MCTTEERPCEDAARRRHLHAEERGLGEANLASTWIWDFQPPESSKIDFCCLSYPVCGIYGKSSRLIQQLSPCMCVVSVCEIKAAVLESRQGTVLSLGGGFHVPW